MPAATREAAPTFSATARTVQVPVAVLDGRGERRPIRIALALDVSLSMTGKIDAVARAPSHFIDLLEPADEIWSSHSPTRSTSTTTLRPITISSSACSRG